jgi:hypothetical protein
MERLLCQRWKSGRIRISSKIWELRKQGHKRLVKRLLIITSVALVLASAVVLTMTAVSGHLPPQSEINNWKVAAFGEINEKTTIERIEYGSTFRSGGQENCAIEIPIGTILYPLRIHVKAVLAGPNEMRGTQVVIIDQNFYQDPFGKWLSFKVKSRIEEFVPL